MWARMGTWLTYAGLTATGFVAGVMGSFLQAITVAAGPIPVGLAVALALAGAVFVAGARLRSGPIAVGLPAAGWLLGVLPFTFERPEGDVILSGDLRSHLYLLLGAGLALVVASLVRVRDRGY